VAETTVAVKVGVLDTLDFVNKESRRVTLPFEFVAFLNLYLDVYFIYLELNFVYLSQICDLKTHLIQPRKIQEMTKFICEKTFKFKIALLNDKIYTT